MMKNFVFACFLLVLLTPARAQENFKYNHILITNDDGIEDADRLLALAAGVKKTAKRVSIVVAAWDRSGTSNHTTFGKYRSTLEVTCKYIDEENSIYAYELPGNPADCILLGLNGLFPDDKPDLVLSGINGGANIGPEWFGSGTIGAIRMAAFLGVTGVALSGFDDDDERSFEVIPNWVAEFISTNIVDHLDKNSYLTIGFPDVPLQAIKGIKISERRISPTNPSLANFNKILGGDPHQPDSKTIWSLQYRNDPNPASAEFDDSYLEDGFIVITPMSINENNLELLDAFTKQTKEIPEFRIAN